jgi:hypothetical protein
VGINEVKKERGNEVRMEEVDSRKLKVEGEEGDLEMSGTGVGEASEKPHPFKNKRVRHPKAVWRIRFA